MVVADGAIIGAAGVAQLDNYEGNVCELQKMYFLEEARGKGLGSEMMKICLDAARRFGYDQCCLLYTSPSPRDQRGSRMPSSA